MRKVLNKIFDVTNRIVLWFSTIALFFMTAIVFYQVIARYVFNKPPMWTEEIALITLIWISMLGAGVGVRTGIHVRVEAFINIFPKLICKIIDTCILLLIASFGVGMSYYTFLLVKRLPNKMAATGIPVWWMYLPAAICGILVVFSVITRIIIDIFGGEKR